MGAFPMQASPGDRAESWFCTEAPSPAGPCSFREFVVSPSVSRAAQARPPLSLTSLLYRLCRFHTLSESSEPVLRLWPPPRVSLAPPGLSYLGVGSSRPR